MRSIIVKASALDTLLLAFLFALVVQSMPRAHPFIGILGVNNIAGVQHENKYLNARSKVSSLLIVFCTVLIRTCRRPHLPL